jgi:hypothetical protein
MNGTLVGRLAPIAGILFAILLVVGTGLIGDHPDPDASEQEIADYFADSDKHTLNIVGAYFWALAGVAFLLFLSYLRSVLRQAEGGAGTLANLCFASGLAFTILLMTGGAAIAAVAGAIEFRDAPITTVDLIRTLPQMGYAIILLGGGFAAIGVVLTTSIIILQTGVLPQWLGWLGIVAAIVLIFSIIFLPMIALVVWVLAVSIVLLIQPKETTTAAA